MEFKEALKESEKLLTEAENVFNEKGLRAAAVRFYRGGYIPAFKKDGEIKGVYDPVLREFEEVADTDIEYAGDLDRSPAYILISEPDYKGEVLVDPDIWDYANTFRVLLDGKVVAHGYFIDDVMMFCDFDKKKFKPLLKDVLKVIREYKWVNIDAFRGYYDAERETGGWVKVADGWVGWGTLLDGSLTFIKNLYDAKLKTDFPVIFILPRSSNVAVQYFSVWVKKQHVDRFKEIAGEALADEFSLKRGVNIQVYI